MERSHSTAWRVFTDLIGVRSPRFPPAIRASEPTAGLEMGLPPWQPQLVTLDERNAMPVD
jgi:hypothetical protein